MNIWMADWMIWQSEMKNLQIKWEGVDGIINMKFIAEYLHQGEVFWDQFFYPLFSGLLTMGWFTFLYEYD